MPYHYPPIPCGEYLVTDDFGDKHKFHFRRMPRAAKYTGRYGVWYHDPDAHWVLVGWVDHQKGENKFNKPADVPAEFTCRLDLFLLGKRELTVRRCAWCGRQLVDNEEFMHDSIACTKNLVPS